MSYMPTSTDEAILYYGCCEGNVVRTIDGDGLLIQHPSLGGELDVYLFSGGRRTYKIDDISEAWSNVDSWAHHVYLNKLV